MYQDMPEGEFVENVTEEMERWMFLKKEDDMHQIKICPLTGKIQGSYPQDYTGGTEMMNSRWQANKIGLINFWYYDEQEFPFVKGRILLRGSNGSGKSVTMQSVVPLFLDGNMSPERLDPFGSRRP